MTNDKKKQKSIYRISQNHTPDISAQQHTEISEIIEVFYDLNIEQQAIFLFHVQHGHDNKTIAALLNYPIGYVKTQLHIIHRLMKNTNKQRWKEALQIDLSENAFHPCHWVLQVSTYFNVIRDITEENLKFSERQKKKIRLYCRWIRWEKKIIATIATIIILSISMAGINVLQSAFHQNVNQDFSTEYLNLFGETKLKSIENLYLPRYLPNGYVFSGQKGKAVITETFYTNNNKEILLQQSLKNFVFHLDTTTAILSEVNSNKIHGYMIKNKNLNTLVWSDDNYFYLLKSNIKEKELIKIANSCKRNKR